MSTPPALSRLAALELTLDVALPFLGLAAVLRLSPDWGGALVLTGWLVAVLDATLAALIARSATLPDVLKRVAAAAIVLAGQGLSGVPGWEDWAIQSAVAGMGARGVAIALAMLSKLGTAWRTDRSAFWSGLQIAGPGLLFILGFSGVTVAAFGAAWATVHDDPLDVVTLGLAMGTAVSADLGRLRRIVEERPAEADWMGGLVIGIVVAWLGLGCAGLAAVT